MSDREKEEASGEASSTSSSGTPYVAGAGPGFDANAPVGRPPTDDAETEAFAELWEEAQVRDWLTNVGAVAHAGFGVGEHDWEFTKADLARIAPPATRILNRYQPTRVVAAYSDPAAVAIGFGLYGWRSTLERTAVLKGQKRRGDQDEPPAAAVPVAPAPQPRDPVSSEAQPEITFAERLRNNRPPPEEETG